MGLIRDNPVFGCSPPGSPGVCLSTKTFLFQSLQHQHPGAGAILALQSRRSWTTAVVGRRDGARESPGRRGTMVAPS